MRTDEQLVFKDPVRGLRLRHEIHAIFPETPVPPAKQQASHFPPYPEHSVHHIVPTVGRQHVTDARVCCPTKQLPHGACSRCGWIPR